MTTQAELDQRYGRTPGRRRRGLVSAVAVGAVLTGGLGWVTVSNALDDVGVDTTGFLVQDERTVSLRFQVTAPRGAEVACALEAQDEDHGIVGWRIVEIPPSEDPTSPHVESIPTVALATTGLVNSCWVT